MIANNMENLRLGKLILNCFIYWLILGVNINKKINKYIITLLLILFGFYDEFLPSFLKNDFLEDLSFSITILIKNEVINPERKFSFLEMNLIIVLRILGVYFLRIYTF
jgi:hypothetical protein